MSVVKTERIVGVKPSPNGTHVVLTTATGKVLSVLKAQYVDNSFSVSYIEHKKGSSFIATKDSSTLNPDTNEPIYLKGEEVKRREDGYEVTGYQDLQSMKGALELQLLEKQLEKLSA